ncbi:hypothetical protein AN641_02955 [Candidatus Epulonipiscioides gigas]|nr:hypothetical protein AN641_02955 [Epulopiscium sp. SCG-C07WGA-EpuloA2]
MDIIGHTRIKNYFEKVIKKNKISHSYIFDGNKGVGKKSLANQIAKILLCENPDETKSCGTCSSCILFDAKTHPDFIEIEKDTKITKISTIKEQFLKEVYIKPYKGKYKIFLIKETDSLQVDSQNAILKTVEEPPPYVILFLITTNINKLLPTIKSRCIHICFNTLSNTQMLKYCENYSRNDLEMQLKFAQGSIGILKENIEDENFLTNRKISIDYLIKIYMANLTNRYKLIESFIEDKDNLLNNLEFWKLFFRDLLLYKRTETTNLYFNDYKDKIIKLTQEMSYNQISQNIQNIDIAIKDIQNNINITLVMENLFLEDVK